MDMTDNSADDPAPLVFQKSERIYLDHQSPIPLYHQLEKVILDRISQDDMLHRMMPPESDLVEIFGVSKITVKKSLEALVKQGLMERKRGFGTRVLRQKITEDLAKLKSYTEEMAEKHLTTSTQVLKVVVTYPGAETRIKLKMKENEKVLSVSRLRGTSEAFPIVYLHSDIPVSFGISPKEDFNGSLYKLIEEKYRIPIIYAHQVIEAAKAHAEEARVLLMEKGGCVLVMERLTYTMRERPVELVRAVYNPDLYKYSIRLKR
ncbi:MAG: GntR family transcriptional regulator [bacterium]|nr:GntR family transcriptional regulator [Candidatus Sumerlaeota bacterium]